MISHSYGTVDPITPLLAQTNYFLTVSLNISPQNLNYDIHVADTNLSQSLVERRTSNVPRSWKRGSRGVSLKQLKVLTLGYSLVVLTPWVLTVSLLTYVTYVAYVTYVYLLLLLMSTYLCYLCYLCYLYYLCYLCYLCQLGFKNKLFHTWWARIL